MNRAMMVSLKIKKRCRKVNSHSDAVPGKTSSPDDLRLSRERAARKIRLREQSERKKGKYLPYIAAGTGEVVKLLSIMDIHNPDTALIHPGVILLPLRLTASSWPPEVFVYRKKMGYFKYQWGICHGHISLNELGDRTTFDDLGFPQNPVSITDLDYLAAVLRLARKSSLSAACEKYYFPGGVVNLTMELIDIYLEGGIAGGVYEREITKVYGCYISEEMQEVPYIRKQYLDRKEEFCFQKVESTYFSLNQLKEMYKRKPKDFTISLATFLDYVSHPDGETCFLEILGEATKALQQKQEDCRRNKEAYDDCMSSYYDTED